MANQNQVLVDTRGNSLADANSWLWPICWLLSFIFPFLLLLVLTYCLRNRNVDGVTTLVLILGTFSCGLIGSVWAFRGARLSVLKSVLLLFATLVAYCIGCVVLLIVCIMALGVVAT